MLKKKRIKRPIVVLLTGFILLGGSLLFGGVMSSYLRRFNHTLEEENRVRMSETGENIRTYMNAIIDNTRKSLYNIADAMAVIPEKDRMPYLEQVVSQDNLVYIGYAGRNGQMDTTLSSVVKDISAEPYFQSALAGEYTVTGVVNEILKNRAVSGVLLSVPLPDGKGVLTAMLSLRQLETALETKSFGGEGYSYIIDSDGSLVLHQRSMDYYNFFNLLDNVTFEKGFDRGSILNDIKEQRAGLTCYSNFNVVQYAYYCPLGLNNWTVVNIVAKDMITRKTDALAQELTCLCAATVAVFLVLTLIAGILYNQAQSRKMVNLAKSEFLANMSHDIRTPMNAIIGMTAIAAKQVHNPEQVARCLDKISVSSHHLLGLINDILDMSKIESGKMALNNDFIALPEVINKIVTIVLPSIQSKGQNFSIRLHHVRHEIIFTDALRLNQVFINILSNAVKFTPNGGSIRIDIEELKLESSGTGYYRFVFSDTGIGMSPDFVKNIFTAFSRERDSKRDSVEGTGLGMAISKKIIDEMQGQIHVESTPGEGSVFTVELSFMLPDSNKRPECDKWPESEQESALLPALRVLIADSDRVICEETAAMLEKMGIAVDWTDSEAEAAIKISDAYEMKEDYDVVILDNKHSALTARTKLGERTPALLLSAYDWESVEKEALASGITEFIQKPMFKSTLYHSLHRLSDGTDRKTEASPDGKECDFTGCRFLLVEDNQLNREIAVELLSATGAVMESACDGEEGVRLFEASPSGYFTLILMDIQMPVMNGYDATKKIRSLKRPDADTIPIIAMTANAFSEDIAACIDAGMNAHLSKPLDMQIVQKTIQSYITFRSRNTCGASGERL